MRFKRKKPIIILIGGRARSGKSTLSKFIEEEYKSQNKKVIISPYTKMLKNYIEIITGKKITESNKPRDLLQQISSKIIKGDLGYKDFFIKRQIEDIEIYSYFADVILVPDVRFPEEFQRIKEYFQNVISIGINRINYISELTEEQKNDVTEISLDNYHDYDFEIKNDEKTDLLIVAKNIISRIKESGDENE